MIITLGERNHRLGRLDQRRSARRRRVDVRSWRRRVAGIGLIFATWWTYFVIPWAEVLSVHREMCRHDQGDSGVGVATAELPQSYTTR